MARVISLEPELLQLDPPPARLIAEERREIFSLFGELRAASYVAVLLITTGVGIVIAKHADRIGPMTIIVALLLVAAGCYWFALHKRDRTIVGDYVLLLGALLVSAAIGYAESQFHLLGANWARHFLLLALLHIATAYAFDSRLVLTAGLTSLAAWFGVERTLDLTATFGLKAILCAAMIIVLRLVNRHRPFDEVYEHFAALLALAAGLSWTFDSTWRYPGVLATLAFAAVLIWRGLRVRSEAFVVYAILAATIAIDTAFGAITKSEALVMLFVLMTTPAMIIILFVMHQRLKETT
jgi:hypothetical protein